MVAFRLALTDRLRHRRIAQTRATRWRRTKAIWMTAFIDWRVSMAVASRCPCTNAVGAQIMRWRRTRTRARTRMRARTTATTVWSKTCRTEGGERNLTRGAIV